MKHKPNPFLPTIDTKSFQRLVGTELPAADLSMYALPPLRKGAITPGFPDFDRDGVPDLFDCDMHDPTRDGWAGDIYRSTREFVTPNYPRAARRRSAASATLISYAARPARTISGYGAQTADYAVQRQYQASLQRPRSNTSRQSRTPQKSFVPDNIISAAGARTADYVVHRSSGAGTRRGISYDTAKRETFDTVRGIGTQAATSAVRTGKRAATSAVQFVSNFFSSRKPSSKRTAPPAKVRPTSQKVVTVRKPAKVPQQVPGSSKFTPTPVAAPRHRLPKAVSRSRSAGMVYHPEYGYIRSV